MVLNSDNWAYTRCLAGKVCGLVRSTCGTSLGEGKLGARDRILNTKVAPGKHSPIALNVAGTSEPMVRVLLPFSLTLPPLQCHANLCPLQTSGVFFRRIFAEGRADADPCSTKCEGVQCAVSSDLDVLS